MDQMPGEGRGNSTAQYIQMQPATQLQFSLFYTKRIYLKLSSQTGTSTLHRKPAGPTTAIFPYALCAQGGGALARLFCFGPYGGLGHERGADGDHALDISLILCVTMWTEYNWNSLLYIRHLDYVVFQPRHQST